MSFHTARLPHAITSLFAVKPSPQMREMYAFLSIFNFAASLVGIFVPVFLWQQGFSLSVIALLYALHYVSYAIAMPLGGRFAARFGLERSLALSTPIFVAVFLTIAAVPSVPNLVWVSFLLLTAHKIFYWPAHHAIFASNMAKNNRGTELSWVRFVSYSTGIIGPLIGGAVALALGFPALFIIAAVILSLSSIPILRTREHFQVAELDYSHFWREIRAPGNERMITGMIGWGEDLVFLVFWPIFMFMILGNPQTLGIVIAISSLAMSVWAFVIGEMTDRHTPRTVLRLAAPVFALSYVVRFWVTTGGGVLMADIFNRLASASTSIPFLSRLYTLGVRRNPLVYVLAAEIVLAITKAVFALLLAYVFWQFPLAVAFKLTFAIAAVLALLYASL